MRDLFNNEPTGAIFSQDRKYRFVLWRVWDCDKPKLMFIGINPSIADAMHDDPTIRRLIAFTKAEQFGGFYILNLFTFISTSPYNLLLTENPTHLADDYLYEYYNKADKIVFMWGNNKVIGERAKSVIKTFPGAYCFGKNKDGSPKHPLYLSSKTNLQLYGNERV